MSSVSNGLYFLTLPLVSVMRVIYRKISHARYLYIKGNVEKVWGARYLSKNTVLILSVCSLVMCACNAHAQYCIDMWPVLAVTVFSHIVS